MRDAVICEPVRTPVGRYGGIFKDIPAVELAATVVGELVRRTNLDPALIDDVIFGECYPNGEAPAIGRIAALDAKLGVRVPGLQIDRRCGSGLHGTFAEEIIAVKVKGRSGVQEISKDEHPRADASMEQLAALKGVRLGMDAEATVTAGNASGQNDGAAACIVTTREKARA